MHALPKHATTHPARALRHASATVVLLALSTAASAAPTDAEAAKARCGAAYEAAQEARAKRTWLDARKELLVCAQDECPAFVRKDCSSWLEEVTRAIPTFVLIVKYADGQDVMDYEVHLDGKRLRTDAGAAIEGDPGEHQLTISAANHHPAELKLMLREGEQHRQVEVTLKPRSSSAAVDSGVDEGSVSIDPSTSSAPILGYVLGGVGVVGLGAFGYFALTGSQQRRDLENDCKPACPQADVDAVDRKFLFADISLGVGLVSLGVAAYLILTHDGGGERAHASLPLNVHPMAGGGVGTWITRF
ncbi:MAG: hypothetical protein KIT72_00830 [Polyangiaceae bacterium]|nr:hypothetical protein [Polyangiaceae bacterium]MCW5788940.1 hypothetical protein [Polyangiaceae bacterium]